MRARQAVPRIESPATEGDPSNAQSRRRIPTNADNPRKRRPVFLRGGWLEDGNFVFVPAAERIALPRQFHHQRGTAAATADDVNSTGQF